MEPLLDAKDRRLAKAQDSSFLFLVIQDHIEFVGKPILLKGDEVLLNGLLAQLVICSKALNHFIISTYVPNQKSNSAPRFDLSGATEFF